MNYKIKDEIDSYFKEYLNIRSKKQDEISIGDRYSFADLILKNEFEIDNNDLAHIYKKVVLLNSLYSTNIYATFDLALNISKIKEFNVRVQDGDLHLVEEIRKNNISGKNKDFYSFATKYCHHHNSKKFPIYDSFVEVSLIEFSQDIFTQKIIRNKLKDYYYFKEQVDSLASVWNLSNDYLYTKIDKYLWQKGKELKNKVVEHRKRLNKSK